jgi:hypothetical protein
MQARGGQAVSVEPDHATHFYGIDPGSGKPWAVFRACRPISGGALAGGDYTSVPIRKLDELIDEIAGWAAARSSVLVSIDAPVNCIDLFDAPGLDTAGRHYPFNANPFTTRPCEKALATKPGVVNRSLIHRQLVDMIAALCGWHDEYKAKTNLSFVKRHEGVSVLGYMRAPHGPVVSLFVRRLRARHADVCFSPREAASPSPGRVYVLESHPAVSLGFWAEDGRLAPLTAIPKYKEEKLEQEPADAEATGGEETASTVEGGLRQLRGPVVSLAGSGHSLTVRPPKTDDELDALVGLLNLLDLAGNKGDWFGCERLGYFLVPRFGRYPKDCPDTISEAWEQAFATLGGNRAGPIPFPF